MFIFKRKASLSKEHLKELENIVSSTIEYMLQTREETIHFIEKYDLVLIFSWEYSFIEGNLYKLSDFHFAENGLSSLLNDPLYTEIRYLKKENRKGIKYINDSNIKGLSHQSLLAFHHICELISTVEFKILSPRRYRCFWR